MILRLEDFDSDHFCQFMISYASMHPRCLSLMLRVVSDNWNKMVDTQNRERESSHLNALSNMLDNLWALHLSDKRKKPRLFSNLECCTLLDAMDAVMPDGIGKSTAHREIARHFADSCRALKFTPECDFIKKIRGRSELLRNIYHNHPLVENKP